MKRGAPRRALPESPAKAIDSRFAYGSTRTRAFCSPKLRGISPPQSILARGILEDEHSDLVLGSSAAIVYMNAAINAMSWAWHCDMQAVA